MLSNIVCLLAYMFWVCNNLVSLATATPMQYQPLMLLSLNIRRMPHQRRFVQGVEPPKKLDYTKRKEQALRKHLDHISDALASARAAGQAAGAPAGGLGYGDAWPVPVAGQARQEEKKATMKKRTAVVRNAERPQTPIHEPPPDDDETHHAATFLQRLLRGRAIQNDMLEAAAARDALLTELLHPLRTDLSVGVTVAPQEAQVANMVASSVRPLLMCAAKQLPPPWTRQTVVVETWDILCRALAVDDVTERQALMAELARQRQAVMDMPDEGVQDEPTSDCAADVAKDTEIEQAALRIQCGFRGLQVCAWEKKLHCETDQCTGDRG